MLYTWHVLLMGSLHVADIMFKLRLGVVAGLVWTAAGGGVQCVECVAVTRGEGRSEGAMGECLLL